MATTTDNAQRKVVLGVRLEPTDRAELERRAADEGLLLSELVRSILAGEAERTRHFRGLYAA